MVPLKSFQDLCPTERKESAKGLLNLGLKSSICFYLIFNRNTQSISSEGSVLHHDTQRNLYFLKLNYSLKEGKLGVVLIWKIKVIGTTPEHGSTYHILGIRHQNRHTFQNSFSTTINPYENPFCPIATLLIRDHH